MPFCSGGPSARLPVALNAPVPFHHLQEKNIPGVVTVKVVDRTTQTVPDGIIGAAQDASSDVLVVGGAGQGWVTD